MIKPTDKRRSKNRLYEKSTKEQNKMASHVEVLQCVGDDMQVLAGLVKRRGFTSNSNAQAKAAEMYQGIQAKLETLKMIARYESGDFKRFEQQLDNLNCKFSKLVDRIKISADITDNTMVQEILAALPEAVREKVKQRIMSKLKR